MSRGRDSNGKGIRSADAKRMLQKSPLEFMTDRLFDMLVLPKARQSGLINRITYIYAEMGRASSFDYSLDSLFKKKEREGQLRSAMLALLVEVRSRCRSKHEFTVWFLTEQSRDWTINEAKQHLANHASYGRFIEELVSHAKLANDDSESDEVPTIDNPMLNQ